MSIQFINGQIEFLLSNRDSSLLNPYFKANEFKKKIQAITNQFNETCNSSSYQQFFDLHSNVRQLRVHKWKGMSEWEWMELEQLIAKKLLKVKVSHFDYTIESLTNIQKCREKNWALYLSLIGRAFRLKEPFKHYESLLKKGLLWKTCRPRFYRELELAVSKKKGIAIKTVIDRTYAIFRHIHRFEEELILDYLNDILMLDGEIVHSCHEKIEEQLVENLNQYTIAIQKNETFASIYKFLRAQQEQSRLKDPQDYLLQGVCVGATVHYIESKMGIFSFAKGMQISSKARFCQLSYDMSHYFNYAFNESLINYSILEADLNEKFEIQPELDSLALQKEKVKNEKREFANHLDKSYSRTIIPPFLGKQLKIELEEIIGPFGSLYQQEIVIDEFILNVLDQLVQRYKNEKESHFILTVAENAVHLKQEKKKILTSKELDERTLAILGEGAPEVIQRRVKASLIEEEGETGHAVYLSLTSPFEFQDPNVPECEGLYSTNLESFKWMLLAWFTRYPYQTISGLYHARNSHLSPLIATKPFEDSLR